MAARGAIRTAGAAVPRPAGARRTVLTAAVAGPALAGGPAAAAIAVAECARAALIATTGTRGEAAASR